MSSFDELEIGDTVVVRVKGDPSLGSTMQAKFVAEVMGFRERGITTDQVELDPPWPQVTPVTLRYHDATFEVVEDASEVNF